MLSTFLPSGCVTVSQLRSIFAAMGKIRVGLGYDVHALREGETFILGGIEIEHHKGAFGHSDADVLIHAICDAILGALALGDIGAHFPDNDPKYKGIDSKILLKDVIETMQAKGYRVGNIDSTICLQKPKLRPHIDTMRFVLADIIGIEMEDLSIKATTTEKLGFVGREEGVSAYAVVLLEK